MPPTSRQEAELEGLLCIFAADGELEISAAEEEGCAARYRWRPAGGCEWEGRDVWVTFKLPPEYPEEPPTIDIDDRRNGLVFSTGQSEAFAQFAAAKAGDLLGDEMLFALISDIEAEGVSVLEGAATRTNKSEPSKVVAVEETNRPKVDTRGLSKMQKRKLFDKLNVDGELPRGWNWVDIVSHLSKGPPSSATSTT